MVALGAALRLGHAGVQQHLGVWRHWWLGLGLLHLLHHLLDHRHDLLQCLVAVHANVLRYRREQLVDLGWLLCHLVVLRCAFHRHIHIPVHAVQVPQGQVLLDVIHCPWQVGRRDCRVCAQCRVGGEVQDDLDVGKVILLDVGVGGLAHSHRHVLVGSVNLDWRRRIDHQFVDTGHLDLLQKALNDHFLVEQLRILLHHRHHSLSLGHALGFGEDVRVRDGNNVRYTRKVFAGDL